MYVHPLATVLIFLTALVLSYFVWSRMRRTRITLMLRAAFDADLQHSEEWTLERWRARTAGHKLRDRASAWCKREL